MTEPQHGVDPEGKTEYIPVDQFDLAGVPDSFQRLWNPHRVAYIKRGQSQVKDPSTCPFCAGPDRTDEESLIVHRGQTCYVLLNLYPYNSGHLLVCPYRHVPDYTDISQEEAAEMAELTQIAMTCLRHVARATGFNIGMNQGVTGGAGIAAHLHQHVVPRWSGDVNFMPIIAGAKSMVQTLGENRADIAAAWDEAAEYYRANRYRGPGA